MLRRLSLLTKLLVSPPLGQSGGNQRIKLCPRLGPSSDCNGHSFLSSGPETKGMSGRTSESRKQRGRRSLDGARTRKTTCTGNVPRITVNFRAGSAIEGNTSFAEPSLPMTVHSVLQMEISIWLSMADLDLKSLDSTTTPPSYPPNNITFLNENELLQIHLRSRLSDTDFQSLPRSPFVNLWPRWA